MKLLKVVLTDAGSESTGGHGGEFHYRDCYVSFTDSGALLIYDEVPDANVQGLTSTQLREAWAPGTWARAWRVDEPPKEG